MRAIRGTAATVAVLLGAVLSACGAGGAPEGGAVPEGLAEARAWTEPGAYTYTLDSSCGERSGIGRFRVTVRDGVASEVVDLDDGARGEPRWEGEPMTIGALVEAAQAAHEDGADVVTVKTGADGRPEAIDIDRWRNAVDDEACYRMTEFSAGPRR